MSLIRSNCQLSVLSLSFIIFSVPYFNHSKLCFLLSADVAAVRRVRLFVSPFARRVPVALKVSLLFLKMS